MIIRRHLWISSYSGGKRSVYSIFVWDKLFTLLKNDSPQHFSTSCFFLNFIMLFSYLSLILFVDYYSDFLQAWKLFIWDIWNFTVQTSILTTFKAILTTSSIQLTTPITQVTTWKEIHDRLQPESLQFFKTQFYGCVVKNWRDSFRPALIKKEIPILQSPRWH